jgi:YebC/PmpR family DNA-binding regulatory protein
MPQQNIDRAIKRGTGELPGVSYDELTYEGYGPGGVAVLVETLTDNKNRTTSDLRHIFSKSGGSLGSAGCVAWMFDHKGVVTIDGDYDEETVLSVAMEAGAEDVRAFNSTFEIVTEPGNLEALKGALEKSNITYTNAEATRVPQSTVKLEGKKAERILRMMDMIEEHDDVQHVYANFDVPDEMIQAMAG